MSDKAKLRIAIAKIEEALEYAREVLYNLKEE